MKNCPVCNAGYKGGERCHRCKTDLGMLLSIEHGAENCLVCARNALRKNDYKKMLYFARKSQAFKAGDEGKRIAGLFRP